MSEEVDYSGIDFVNDAERTYFEEARLGISFMTFLRSDVGRFMHGRAKLDLEETKTDILVLSSSDPAFLAEFERLQQKAWCAEHFMQWCSEAIVNGKNAEQQLEVIRE